MKIFLQIRNFNPKIEKGPKITKIIEKSPKLGKNHGENTKNSTLKSHENTEKMKKKV